MGCDHILAYLECKKGWIIFGKFHTKVATVHAPVLPDWVH